jgi:Ohr subfamily peroxiredoxin
MTKILYTADVTATGGRDGRSVAADGKLDVSLAPPVELGGNGAGTNPEQLFAAGYAACFIGAMKFAATHNASLPRVPADATVNARVGIGPREDKGFGLAVELIITCPAWIARRHRRWWMKPTRSAPTATPRAATSRSR